MSQNGLLNEEEIRCFLSESFNLKLDREALLKPTREVVVEVYSRFLDEFHSEWRKLPRVIEREPNTMAIMVRALKNLISRYDINFEFNMGDLLVPIRKRTTAFLNVLIFIRAQMADHWQIWQQMQEEWTVARERGAKIEHEHAKRRAELEQLALKKASLRPIDDLKSALRERNLQFQKLQENADDLSKKKSKEIKAEIQTHTDELERKRAIITQLKEEIDNNGRILENGQEIRRNLPELEHKIQERLKEIKLEEATQQERSEMNNELKHLASLYEYNIEELAKEVRYTRELFANFNEDRKTLEKKIHEASLAKQQDENLAFQEGEESSDLKRNWQLKHIQYQMKEDQAAADLQALKTEISRSDEQAEAHLRELRDEMECLRKQMHELNVQHEQKKKEYQVAVDKANHLFGKMKEKYDVVQSKIEANWAKYKEDKSKLAALLVTQE